MLEKIVLDKKTVSAIEEMTEQKYGISRLILMELAGRKTAECIKSRFNPAGKVKILVASGKGNNGGDGFVALRHLFNMGFNVSLLYMGTPENYTKISFTNFDILCKMKVNKTHLAEFGEGTAGLVSYINGFDVVVDALLGTGVDGPLRREFCNIVEAINKSGKHVVSADIPSGLDADTGRVGNLAVKAGLTVSYGFAKKGFYLGHGPECCGHIEVVDIGFPRFFYENENCE